MMSRTDKISRCEALNATGGRCKNRKHQERKIGGYLRAVCRVHLYNQIVIDPREEARSLRDTKNRNEVESKAGE